MKLVKSITRRMPKGFVKPVWRNTMNKRKNFPKCEECGKTLSRKFASVTKKPIRWCKRHVPRDESYRKKMSESTNGKIVSEETKQKMSETWTKIWKERRKGEDLSEKKKYYNAVRRITRKQKVELLENYGKDGYDLDHIISKIEGLRKQIDPKIIGDISNLRYIPSSENRRLGTADQKKWRRW